MCRHGQGKLTELHDILTIPREGALQHADGRSVCVLHAEDAAKYAVRYNAVGNKRRLVHLDPTPERELGLRPPGAVLGQRSLGGVRWRVVVRLVYALMVKSLSTQLMWLIVNGRLDGLGAGAEDVALDAGAGRRFKCVDCSIDDGAYGVIRVGLENNRC